ncbi:MAG: alpha/beta fold hydrolase [Candidatus Lokiarchaeota archaeon]|nr:alpha/beta fold hydrolase [Candidatus Lokiarchaeota archaeon]
MKNIIFIHGLESSGNGFKGTYLKGLFPNIFTPNFKIFKQNTSIYTLLKERMGQLDLILKKRNSWIIIGSSFGGLMATLYALRHPEKIERLILLAPFLATPLLQIDNFSPLTIPTIIIHGKYDEIAQYQASRERAYQLFTNLKFHTTEDHHDLNNTIKTLNWSKLIT